MNVKVFISYTHADQELHQKLLEHLSPLKRLGKISIWQDQEILPGENWNESIQARLKDADLILLLVSASFIASNYCWDKEVQKALQRHKAGTAKVIPVILRQTSWQDTPLGRLQALPTGGKPVVQWNDQDAAFEDVVQGIRKVVEDFPLREAPRSPMVSPQATTHPQHSAMQLPPLPVRGPKGLHSAPAAVVLILLTLVLLVGGSFGVYQVATGHLPWNPPQGLSTRIASSTTVLPNATSTTPANVTATATPVVLAQPGTKWTTQQSGRPSNLDIQTIIWSGSQFFAVGDAGILTSDNGVTWIYHSLKIPNTFASITWSGTQYVVVGAGGTILTSNDGITWVPRLSGTSNDLQDIIWSRTQSQYIAVGQNGTILTSSDGVMWIPHNLDKSNYFWHIVWSGTQYVLVGDGGAIFTSGDGITWMSQHSNTSNHLLGITASPSQYVAVGVAGTILTSGDGITWVSQASNMSSDLWSITWSGTQYVVAGQHGTILTSNDGITWMSQASNTQQDLLGITWSGSKFIAVGRAGAILSSP